ncbi:MAG TPA: DEAD/DEAH box helicase family protein [Methanosarcina sp.]|nr:DEAD/DEAH box helicase family protein [Methanosarcina sp.]
MKIEKFDESFIRVSATSDIQQGIRDFFTFKAPGYKFNPRFKAKLWNGDISLYDTRTNKLPIGLLDLLKQYAERVEEDIEIIPNQHYTDLAPDYINFDEFASFVEELNLSNDKGERITATDYQIDAAYEALCQRRLVLEMPTGSGKSLTIYIIIRYLMELDKRISLVVPSISLVKQMISDFMEYSILNGFDIDYVTTLLYSGQERNFENPLLISTWQTLSKMIKTSYGFKALNSYDAIIVDEAHVAKGVELQKVLAGATSVPYKIGMTGTIDKQKINELTIIGSLGPIRKVVTTRELMDRGNLSSMVIRGLVLQYDEAISKQVKGFSYKEEIDYLCGNEKRNNLIANLALATSGTTMILCNYVKNHLIPLYEIIKEKAKKTGRPVYAIYGDIDPDERERIRKVAMEEDCILVCSFATCQAGLNCPKIDTVIFAAPSRSSIRVLQSIGRGLRRSINKTMMTLVDIVDDMRYKKHNNTTFDHFMERMKMYRVEQFDVQLKEIKF